MKPAYQLFLSAFPWSSPSVVEWTVCEVNTHYSSPRFDFQTFISSGLSAFVSKIGYCICCPGSLRGLNKGVYTRHLGECVTYNRCSIKAIGSFTIDPKHPGSFLCTTVFPLCYQLAHTECSDGSVNSAPPPCSASNFPKCPCLYL